ncbi:MAG: AmmeMemoRadiSam system protein B [Endomicrobium sp.]|jgi:AmmeMemoRadiSam system protein B|nr:AmmeMemoRadiSam system protein B [Endomicrobium sp.]
MNREMRFKNWYPGSLKEVAAYIPQTKIKKDAAGLIVPHAGWTYSGKTAAAAYASAQMCDTCVILCPSHTGIGPEISVYPCGVWDTPFGGVCVDEEISKAVVNGSKYAEADFTAHIMEHSVEVELPFIKVLMPSAKIVPISVMTQEYGKCLDLAKAIYKSAQACGKKVIAVASSDMSHYADATIAKICDDIAIYHILSLDAKGLLEAVEERNISMCGAAACAVMLEYSKLKGARRAELLRYSNSGEISGDFSEVVGYAGMIVY